MEDLNINKIRKRVWIVKMPRYISEKLMNLEDGTHIGEMKIVKDGEKPSEISLHLQPSTMSNSQEWEEIPSIIPMKRARDLNQVILPLIENPDDISIEGRVRHKLEMQPRTDEKFLNKAAKKMIKAQEPERTTILLKRHVNKFIPLNKPKEVETRRPKEKLTKKEDNEVEAILFDLFEKHEFYKITDLVHLTKQPVVHLKKILHELCIYNMKGPNKFMWTLKPEYKHY